MTSCGGVQQPEQSCPVTLVAKGVGLYFRDGIMFHIQYMIVHCTLRRVCLWLWRCLVSLATTRSMHDMEGNHSTVHSTLYLSTTGGIWVCVFIPLIGCFCCGEGRRTFPPVLPDKCPEGSKPLQTRLVSRGYQVPDCPCIRNCLTTAIAASIGNPKGTGTAQLTSLHRLQYNRQLCVLNILGAGSIWAGKVATSTKTAELKICTLSNGQKNNQLCAFRVLLMIAK